MIPDELSFVSTDDLIAEVAKRHTTSIFIGLKEGINQGGEDCCVVWEGGAHTCLGLLVSGIERIGSHMNRETRDTNT